MEIWEANGKVVKITLKDGQTVQGFAYDYVPDYDNEPDPESITIDNVEIFAPEILRIEEI